MAQWRNRRDTLWAVIILGMVLVGGATSFEGSLSTFKPKLSYVHCAQLKNDIESNRIKNNLKCVWRQKIIYRLHLRTAGVCVSKMNLCRRSVRLHRHKSVLCHRNSMYYSCLLVRVCRNSHRSNTPDSTTHHITTVSPHSLFLLPLVFLFLIIFVYVGCL